MQRGGFENPEGEERCGNCEGRRKGRIKMTLTSFYSNWVSLSVKCTWDILIFLSY